MSDAPLSTSDNTVHERKKASDSASPAPSAAAARATFRWGVGLLPDSAISWGVTAIAAAFVLLSIGAVLSLRRTAKQQSQ